MSLLCLLGRHTPSLASIAYNSGGGLKAICGACAMPLERDGTGKWREAKPLYLRAANGEAGTRPGPDR